MRYTDLTLPEDHEPTYNNFQKVAGGFTIAAIVGVSATIIHSLSSANLFQKGFSMQSLKIITLNPEGAEREFVFECHNNDTAISIVQGTLKGCNETGWTLKEVSFA